MAFKAKQCDTALQPTLQLVIADPEVAGVIIHRPTPRCEVTHIFDRHWILHNGLLLLSPLCNALAEDKARSQVEDIASFHRKCF